MAGCCSALLVFFVGGRLLLRSDQPTEQIQAPPIVIKPIIDYSIPAREIPRSFRARTHKPNAGEGATSGSIDLASFSAGRDLIRIDDPRVVWESDNDTNDDEDDHMFNIAMETPMRRLFELVDQAGGVLEVTDSYRAVGVHGVRSLHKEGRAVDLISTGIDLQHLARLTWASGFDWVLYESPKRGGAHIHASVRRLP